MLAALFWGSAPAAVLLAVATGVLLFFRDPDRSSSAGARALLSPADGRVVAVRHGAEAQHPLARETCRCISIFMSPLDVHVNRIPVAGCVAELVYRKGRFRAAYTPAASEANESNALLIRTRAGLPVVVVQVAGWLARRIVCRVREGDGVVRGQRFGVIMFGSRVDVYLPEQIVPTVEPGQRVIAGATVIAELSEG